MTLPPVLKKKIGPLPLGVWLVAGAAGIGVGLYLKKRRTAGTSTDLTATDAVNSQDMSAYPYAADTTSGIGGGGGGNAPLPTDGYLPPADTTSGMPGDSGFLAPVTSQLIAAIGVPGTPGNCPPNYYWNGVLCMPKVVAGSARVQPGATAPAAPGTPRKCPKQWHWNGFDCVPDAAAPSPTRRALAKRVFG